MAADVAALVVALALTQRPSASSRTLGARTAPSSLIFAALLPLWILIGNAFGLYRLPERTTDWSFADDLSSAFVVCSIWGWFWLLGMSAIAVGSGAALADALGVLDPARSAGPLRRPLPPPGTPTGTDSR